MLPDVLGLPLQILRPGWLVALVIALPLVYLATGPQRPGQSPWAAHIAPHLLAPLTHRLHAFALRRPLALALTLLAGIALAGPSWRAQSAFPNEDAPLLILALDLSPGMERSARLPDDLTVAKTRIARLVDQRTTGPTSGARVGLIAFGTGDRQGAYQALPPTDDGQVIHHTLPALQPDILPATTPAPTSRGGAEIFRLFGQIADREDRPATLLILTNRPEAVDPARHAGTAFQPRHTVVVADPRDTPDLAALLDNSRRARAPGANRTPLDDGYWLVFPIAALFLILHFRVDRARLKALIPGAVALLLTTLPHPSQAQGFMDLWLSGDQQGARLFEQGDYAGAANAFTSPRWRAAALYQAGNYRAAEQLYARFADPEGYYNYGNALARQEKYLQAELAYARALELAPDHTDARANLDIIRAILNNPALPEEQADETAAPPVDEAADPPDDGEDAPTRRDRDTDDALAGMDPALVEAWLKSTRHDLSDFLRQKFQMQRDARDTGGGPP